MDLQPGTVVFLDKEGIGVLHYIGELHFGNGGTWVGVELAEAIGNYDGSIQGRRYFTCQPGFGTFAPVHAVKRQIPIQEVISKVVILNDTLNKYHQIYENEIKSRDQTIDELTGELKDLKMRFSKLQLGSGVDGVGWTATSSVQADRPKSVNRSRVNSRTTPRMSRENSSGASLDRFEQPSIDVRFVTIHGDVKTRSVMRERLTELHSLPKNNAMVNICKWYKEEEFKKPEEDSIKPSDDDSSNLEAESVCLVTDRVLSDAFELSACSSQGPLPVPLARLIFRQACAGLRVFHDQNKTHGDVCLKNIALDDAFRIRMADFGPGGRFYGKMGGKGVGNRFYKAPEIVEDPDLPFTPAVDIFALGVCLFELLTRRRVFTQSDSNDSNYRLIQLGKFDEFWSRLDDMPSLSQGAKDLINKMVDPNPASRISLRNVEKHPWYLGSTEDIKDAIEAFRELILSPKPVMNAAAKKPETCPRPRSGPVRILVQFSTMSHTDVECEGLPWREEMDLVLNTPVSELVDYFATNFPFIRTSDELMVIKNMVLVRDGSDLLQPGDEVTIKIL